MRRIELQNQMHTSSTLKSIKFGRFELYSAEGDYMVDFGSLPEVLIDLNAKFCMCRIHKVTLYASVERLSLRKVPRL